jgi:hypothetical protein
VKIFGKDLVADYCKHGTDLLSAEEEWSFSAGPDQVIRE